MLQDDPQLLFDQFLPQAREYLDSPGLMAALELDKTCMKLYPAVARMSGNNRLSNLIRDFARSLPRKEAGELRNLLDQILVEAKAGGLAVPDRQDAAGKS
ncbi:hypothetical protein [Thiolapillus sp.]